MKAIYIIGTDPPCSRCGLLSKFVEDFVKKNKVNAIVYHLDYSKEKAQTLANEFGLKAGTAKDVAIQLKRKINFLDFNQSAIDFENPRNKEYKEYKELGWIIEFDEFLRPYEDAAKDFNILMTPTLIINNEIKHSGSVPQKEDLEKWLNEIN